VGAEKHPAVAEAAAIGIPDPLKGESIKVFVQTRSDYAPSVALSAMLIELVRRELGPIAIPSALVFVSSFPKTRRGKIMRRFLKAKETGNDSGDVSMLDG
jgi:acetyl-CoA synthetase